MAVTKRSWRSETSELNFESGSVVFRSANEVPDSVESKGPKAKANLSGGSERSLGARAPVEAGTAGSLRTFPEGKPYRPGASRTGANVRTRGTRSALSIAQGARREMIQSESLDPKHNQIPTN